MAEVYTAAADVRQALHAVDPGHARPFLTVHYPMHPLLLGVFYRLPTQTFSSISLMYAPLLAS